MPSGRATASLLGMQTMGRPFLAEKEFEYIHDHTQMNGRIKISHCLFRGKLTSVSSVKRGYNPEYICISCGHGLVARKGDVNVHHFAHLSAEHDDLCTYDKNAVLRYGESVAHKYAKEAISKLKSITLPPIVMRMEDKDCFGKRIESTVSSPKDGSLLTFEVIGSDVEVFLGSMKPDVVLSTKFGNLAVEVAVTHFCDEEKIKKYKELDLPAIEIDLSDVITVLKNDFGEFFYGMEEQNIRSIIDCSIFELSRYKWINVTEKKRQAILDKLTYDIDMQKAESIKKKQSIEKAERELRQFEEYVRNQRLNQKGVEGGKYSKTILDSLSFNDLYKSELLEVFGVSSVSICLEEYGDFVFDCKPEIWKTLVLLLFYETISVCDFISFNNGFQFDPRKVFLFIEKNVNITGRNYYKKFKGLSKDAVHFWAAISSFLKTFSYVQDGRWVVEKHFCENIFYNCKRNPDRTEKEGSLINFYNLSLNQSYSSESWHKENAFIKECLVCGEILDDGDEEYPLCSYHRYVAEKAFDD